MGSIPITKVFAWVATGVALFGCGDGSTLGSATGVAGARRGGLIELVPIGTYETGVFNEGAAEIVAHDPATQRLFVVNGSAATIDVLDISDPTMPTLAFAIDVSGFDEAAKKANSVAVSPTGGVIAAAIENVNKQAPGFVAFFDTNGVFLSAVQAGALPDMLTFTPDGAKVLVANEGEPNDDYSIDPEGSITIVNLSGGVANLTQAAVTTADFTAFDAATLDPSIRIYGPGASVAQDLEPEYIAVSSDSRQAWVTLQENNALATVDIASGVVTSLTGLGFKDHSLAGNGFDASDKDGAINITERPTRGMYQPDAIASFSWFGTELLILANEGDSRDYPGYSEEARVEDLVLDPVAFPNAAQLQQPQNLGRLKTTTANGDIDGDGDFDEIYSFGARSFSIRTSSGSLIFDSGDWLERVTAYTLPADFNSTNDENGSFDDRSDDKGPEPEGVTVGRVCVQFYYGRCQAYRTLAFVGLERIGGVAVYDLSWPWSPQPVQYVNTRDFAGVAASGTAGDLGPEGLFFISRADSPIGSDLLVVANEISGTTTIFTIQPHAYYW